MRKSLLAVVIFMASLASVAQAETVSIGGKNITYKVPAGYVQATGGNYDQMLDMMRQAQPRELFLFAMYVPKDVDEALRYSDAATLDRYVTLSYDRRMQKQQFSIQDFRELKQAIRKQQGTLDEGAIASQVNQAVARLGADDFRIGSIKPMGTFGETKTSFSLMMLVTQSTVVQGQRVPMEMGIVSTNLLTGSKLVTVNQYGVIQSPDDLAALRKEAGKVISSLGFKQGGAIRSAFKKQHSTWDYMTTGFLGAVFGGLIGGLGMFLWKRRKGATAGPDGQSGKPASANEITAEVISKVKGIFEKRNKG